MSDKGSAAVLERLDEAVALVRRFTSVVPKLAIVAGSGLTTLADLVEGAVRLPYGEIPHMLAPTVAGHNGELVIGALEGLPVAILSGRIHAYEGHSADAVVFGVRLLGRLGAGRVLLTNAAGGILPSLGPGSLCRIVDHLNLSGRNPLIGPNVAGLGPRFPDMTYGYCPQFGAEIERAAAAASVPLFAGVYAGMSGPSYETPAEIHMLRVIGATMVGMSTVPECIALNHMGVKVGGISVISNYAAGVSPAPLDHAEVAEVAKKAGPRLLTLLRSLARDLALAAAS